MLKNLIDAAICRTECDVVLKNASYVDVFSGKIRKGDIGIVNDRIIGVGSYNGKKEYDVSGKTVVPGYIDAHVHIESSQLSPEEFASLIVPRGTTTIIADPHEITNVCGMAGVEYIEKASKNVPLDVKIQLPSCVPATPFETSGAILAGKDIRENISKNYINGLGEFMNFPGVISADPDVMEKLESAHEAGKVIDGHAPSVSGNALNAYLCGGITTDHECVTIEEIDEKISKGVYVHLRHGSSTRNIVSNSKAVTAANMRRFLMCTDDRHAADLREKGHIDDALRKVVAGGLDPVWAVTIATLNAAECYRLEYRGAIAPFYFADLVVVDNLNDFNAQLVFKDGVLVAENGKPLFDTSKRYLPQNVLNTVHLNGLKAEDFTLTLKGEKANVMTILPGNVVTGCEVMDIKSANGDVVIEGTDVLKMAVVERHVGTGNIGKGLLKGYGFKGGAMGITISHDSHNVILLGDDNESMAKAANELARIGGGMVIVDKKAGKTYSLTLDIAGLMSSRDAESLQKDSKALIERAYSMGVDREQEAFMSLAFLSLAVIPHVKLLDKGLFDVDKFDFMDINA